MVLVVLMVKEIVFVVVVVSPVAARIGGARAGPGV